jgi:hypothetical protein
VRRHPFVLFPSCSLGALAVSASAGIAELGGSTAIAEPPANIKHNQWEHNEEIRVWFGRELVLPNNINLGHHGPGLVNDVSQLDSLLVPAGTAVQSYMIRADPVGNGPILLTGYVVFDTDILGVYIGSQLSPTDNLLGRPGIEYN